MITIEIPAWVIYAIAAFSVVTTALSAYHTFLTRKLRAIEEEKLLLLQGHRRVEDKGPTQSQRKAHSKRRKAGR